MKHLNTGFQEKPPEVEQICSFLFLLV